MLKLEDVVSKLMQLKHITEGAWGQSPQPRTTRVSKGEAPRCWAIFSNFLEKDSYFNAIWITVCIFSEPLERTKFWDLKTTWKNPSLLLLFKSKEH